MAYFVWYLLGAVSGAAFVFALSRQGKKTNECVEDEDEFFEYIERDF
ncbi:hypothetical protein JYP46_19385 [Nitratireductor aquimarinus]|nr:MULTISPECIES: hypothetical protein [Alphaproteobacteria]MBN7758996.1 hypothetical protein [Nitratireductor aquimarinus]MBY6001669.1 hypothetical protein [Tritonibacter mobilis]MBY6023957.1 hypothetical protein [Nitratireductor sp. DP7N14-4]